MNIFVSVLFCVLPRSLPVYLPLTHPISLSFFLFRILRTLIPITTRRAIRLSGQSPVHSAADGGQVQCLELLIQKGYDVNALLHAHISGTNQLDAHVSYHSEFLNYVGLKRYTQIHTFGKCKDARTCKKQVQMKTSLQ